MRRFTTLAGFLMALTLGAAACDTNTASDFTAPTDVTFDLADLAEILFARGVPVEIGSEEMVHFFPVPVRHFLVFGADVQVFEFPSSSTAAAVANTVSPDGATINGQVIDWPATPHFFRSGQVIALYLGDDAQVHLALEDIMGPQFAGGEVPFTVVTEEEN